MMNKNNHDKNLFKYTEKCLYEFRANCVKLERLKAGDGRDDNKKLISEEELRDAYKALADVVPQMDYDAVEMILEQLGEFRLPDKDAEKIKELAKMLKSFDWDGMEALIQA